MFRDNGIPRIPLAPVAIVRVDDGIGLRTEKIPDNSIQNITYLTLVELHKKAPPFRKGEILLAIKDLRGGDYKAAGTIFRQEAGLIGDIYSPQVHFYTALSQAGAAYYPNPIPPGIKTIPFQVTSEEQIIEELSALRKEAFSETDY